MFDTYDFVVPVQSPQPLHSSPTSITNFLSQRMVRRFANQVHQQVSRLMRANLIQNEPVWFRAVLQYPPVPLPAKAPPSRTEYDNRIPKPSYEPGQRTNLKRTRNKPLPIQYIEDDLRRQFFRDHPFEAFRPRTLVEGVAIEPLHSVSGKAWTRLRQRGRNPTPEDAIRFAMSLHECHGLSLSDAYCRAVAQFRALRSEHHIATAYAVYEAEAFGSNFGPSEIEKAFEREKEVLETWKQEEQVDDSARMATKRWRAIIARDPGEGNWTKGEEYVRLWKANIKPECAPQLTEPMTEALANTVSPSSTLASSKMHVTSSTRTD